MILIPIIDPKIFFGTIAGCIFVGVLIKLHEILTYKKDKPNPLDPFPVEVTLVYKYILVAGIVCALVLFTKYITLPLIKYMIDMIRSLF